MNPSNLNVVSCFASLLAVSGCLNSGDRPELGAVTGTVTLDGEPLVGAVVMFLPEGRPKSRGQTDESGRYELGYLRDIRGAVVGEHRVAIDLLPTPGGEAGDRLPPRYNAQTELTATVEPGTNTFDWALTSADPGPSAE